MPFDAVKTSLSPSDYKSEIPPVVSPLDSKDSLSEHIKKCQKTMVAWAFQHLSMWVSVGIGNVYFQVRSWWIPAMILARIQLPWIKPFFFYPLADTNHSLKVFPDCLFLYQIHWKASILHSFVFCTVNICCLTEDRRLVEWWQQEQLHVGIWDKVVVWDTILSSATHW